MGFQSNLDRALLWEPEKVQPSPEAIYEVLSPESLR
jgi:hypothetical protein